MDAEKGEWRGYGEVVVMHDFNEVTAHVDVLACSVARCSMHQITRMWANAQPDGRPAEHRWRPLFNAAKFG